MKGEPMGKDLKGKELGEGLSQRKNGRYSARFRSKSGKRIERYFDKYHEAKKWLADAVYEDKHGTVAASSDMTVDVWFNFWMQNYKRSTLRDTTYQGYLDCYEHRIKPYIGDMPLSEVKAMHCQNIMNQLSQKDYSHRTILDTRQKLHCMFESAVENKLVASNPITKSVRVKDNYDEQEPRVLTVDEQNRFLKLSKRSSYDLDFRFVLQTGIRCGELCGLKWSDIDWKKGVIHIRRSLIYLRHGFVEHQPKTRAGIRDIPMTKEVRDILKEIKDRKARPYSAAYHDNIFVNSRGNPTTATNYDKALKAISRKAGMENVSMHSLRHTFATRCFEAGMNPKTLQRIMGHSDLSITMNLYVHVTDDTVKDEMTKFEQMGVKWA